MTPNFDGTITLGNIVTIISFISMAMLAWRDMNWRMKNLEAWKIEQESIKISVDVEYRKLADGASMLREAIAKLTSMNEGQERRIVMLEDRHEFNKRNVT